jgi:DNA replication protein DnaC
LLHAWLSCDVLIFNEFGYLSLYPQIGPMLYAIIAGRYGKGTTIVTSN